MTYREVQGLAKTTMRDVQRRIEPGMSLKEIREFCEKRMLELGADSFWYWDIGAFCFAGEETTVSVAGPKYRTSDRMIQENDIVTIDLSPQRENIWGDYARTVIIENGRVVENVREIACDEWRMGLLMEEWLHQEMQRFVTVDTTFEELYYHINELIGRNGYVNLDFLGNLGHSIVRDKAERVYIEKGNHAKLSDVGMFTFEPHISVPGAVYGYKREDIYYFADGKLAEL